MDEFKTANFGKWGELLLEFKEIDRNNKQAYLDLIEKAKITAGLTIAQRSGIISRCNNVLNHTYNFGEMTKSDAYNAKENKAQKQSNNK